MKRLTRYGLGYVAFGSLVVSFVECIRFILEGLRPKLKGANSMPESWVGRAAFQSSQFCLRCIGCIIKSVNHNAYIMIAITGKGFFTASEVATDLIMSKILWIGKVNVVGDFILFLGKLSVCWALGYTIVTRFFGVVKTSIDTIILSFCKYCEDHQGTAQYAPPLLMETLNYQNEMQRHTQ